MDTLSDFQMTILNKIHNEVYAKIKENFVDVFLCGGSSKTHQRDIIRCEFEKNKKFRIMYPEDLFMDILNRDKQADLLTLEKFLADNCDIISIVCESAGSFVELGAFINNEKTEKKVIAIIEKRYKKNKSFIILGPVRKLLKMGKYNVVFYEPNKISELVGNLSKQSILKKFENTKMTTDYRRINTLLGLYRFIPLLLFFFNNLTSQELVSYLKFLFQQNEYSEKHFNYLFRGALKLLYKEKSIENSNSLYKLTRSGYDSVRNLMDNIRIDNKLFLYDSIRFSIMKKKMVKCSLSLVSTTSNASS